MKIKVTEGEVLFLEKIRHIKEKTALEFTSEDKLEYLKHKAEEINRYIIYEILR
jgi:hypothetical protein